MVNKLHMLAQPRPNILCILNPIRLPHTHPANPLNVIQFIEFTYCSD